MLTVVRADARKRAWFFCNGVGMRAMSRAPLNKALAAMKSPPPVLAKVLRREDFIERLSLRFPDIAASVDDVEGGLLHLVSVP